MTPAVSVLCLNCLFVMAQMAAAKQTLRLESADVGKVVVLQCLCQDDAAVMFYWYKQILGKRPELMCTFYKHHNTAIFRDEFNHSRFLLDTGNQKNLMLKISDVRTSDSASYYCVKSNLHEFEFCEGTSVSVKGSGSNIQTLVRQSAFGTFQSESSMTVNCRVHTWTCDAEHSVYRFKDAEGSYSGLMYTHGGRNDQCGRNPNTQTNTCVYNLPTNVSDTGSHYCAVASCGDALFGNWSKQVSDDGTVPLYFIYLLSGALAFTTSVVVCLAFSVFKMSKRHSLQTDSSDTFSATYSQNTQLHQNGENVQYAAVTYSANGASRERDDTISECLYSSVKQ